ncbi:MAG: hypothetical protein WBX19_14400 [Terracidiphilus sp.]
MASVTGVGERGVKGGMFGREALVQYAAMARLRWRMFINGLRSIHGLFDLGATGIAWTLYSVLGLGLGLGLCAAAYSVASHSSWQYLPILFWATSFLWLMFPMIVASFQEQSDLGILLRFPVCFGSYFLLYLISGLMDVSTIVGTLCCLGVWLGITIARPDLYLWTTLGLSVFAVFNILLARAVFAWIDRWLAERKTREILGAVFMVLIVSLLVINSVWNQKRYQDSTSHKEETMPFQDAMGKYAPLLKTAEQVQQWLPPGLGARILRKALERKPAATSVTLSALGLWAFLAGGLLAVRLKAEYRGQNLSWAPSRS